MARRQRREGKHVLDFYKAFVLRARVRFIILNLCCDLATEFYRKAQSSDLEGYVRCRTVDMMLILAWVNPLREPPPRASSLENHPLASRIL